MMHEGQCRVQIPVIVGIGMNKVEIKDMLFDDLIVCGSTHENPPPHKDCGEECDFHIVTEKPEGRR